MAGGAGGNDDLESQLAAMRKREPSQQIHELVSQLRAQGRKKEAELRDENRRIHLDGTYTWLFLPNGEFNKNLINFGGYETTIYNEEDRQLQRAAAAVGRQPQG